MFSDIQRYVQWTQNKTINIEIAKYECVQMSE